MTAAFNPPIDSSHVCASLKVLHQKGDVFEVRALEAKFGKAYRPATVSGYFDDPERAATAVMAVTSYSGIYVTLNPVLPDLLARVNNRLKEVDKRGGQTGDRDIVTRRWMLIDCDPVRPSGISSTQEEHDLAIERAGQIEKALSELGWPAPVRADSGNGAHLIYRIDLVNDERSKLLLQACLAALADGYSCEAVTIDQTVYNASRIVKLYGTRSQKGDATATRPHRMSQMVPPDEIAVVPLGMLELLATWAPQGVPPRAYPEPVYDPPVGGAWTEDRLDTWLRDRGFAAGPPTPWQGKSRRILDTCPLCGESDRSAAVFIDAQGVLGFKCHHNRCAGKGWVELREALEPASSRGPQMEPGVDLSGILSPARPAVEVTEAIAEAAPLADGDPGPIPESLLEVPGYIRELMDYTMSTAPYPNKVLAFAGALVNLATLTGRKVRDPGDNRTNLYVLGLALSGAGKDWPRQVNVEILHAVGMLSSLGSKFASGEGLEDSLAQNPVKLYQTDEIDGLLRSINQAKDAKNEAIMGTLLTMYSSAATIVPGRQKAGKDDPGVIDQPHLVLFGTAIPTHYYAALSERMLTNGLVARMLILECGARGEGQEPRIQPVPTRILETAKWWAAYRPSGGNLAAHHPVPRTVPFTAEGAEVVAAIRKDAEKEYAAAESRRDPVGTTVWARVSQMVRKLALIYAVSRDHECPEICGDAVVWASSLVTHQVRRMLAQAALHVAESPMEVLALKALRKIREAPSRELSHSALLKRMKIGAFEFDQVMKTLVDRRDVEVRANFTSGRPNRTYSLAAGESSPLRVKEVEVKSSSI